MLFQIIKKDLLMFWRRPRELITLLVMPFVLIGILGTALGAFNDQSPQLNIKLAVIQKDDPIKAEAAIIQELNKIKLPKQTKEEAIVGVKKLNITNILLEDVFGSKELKKSIHIDKFDNENELSEKEKLSYGAIVEIPKDFTLQYYKYVYFSQGNPPALNVKVNESKSLEAKIVTDILQQFQNEISLWTTVSRSSINPEQLKEKLKESLGTTVTVSKKKPINMVTYYSVGMSVMFIFFVASTMASLAYEQKVSQVYNRILLANVPHTMFFLGIFLTTFLIVFLQINILFGLSALIFSVYWPSLLSYFVVTLLLSIMVSGIAVFLVALCYRAKSEGVSRMFSSFLFPIIAFIGGSFVPVSNLGGLFEKISTYSPAGAGISAYLKVIQGYALADISQQIFSILIITILLIISAIFIQPKRGESA